MANSIQKGSTEHNIHLDGLKRDAKSEDKATADPAAANLKQHEPAKPAEVKTEPNK
jgi:hypothetical protein